MLTIKLNEGELNLIQNTKEIDFVKVKTESEKITICGNKSLILVACNGPLAEIANMNLAQLNIAISCFYIKGNSLNANLGDVIIVPEHIEAMSCIIPGVCSYNTLSAIRSKLADTKDKADLIKNTRIYGFELKVIDNEQIQAIIKQ